MQSTVKSKSDQFRQLPLSTPRRHRYEFCLYARDLDTLDTVDRGPVLLGFFRSMQMWRHGLPGPRPDFIGVLEVDIAGTRLSRGEPLVIFRQKHRPTNGLAEVLFE